MIQYNVIIYNDEERLGGAKQMVEKIVLTLIAENKDIAREAGFSAGQALLPGCQFGVGVEFRGDLSMQY